MPDHAERAATPPEALPRGARALWLTERAQDLPAGILHVTRREGAVSEIVALARHFAPDLEVIALPAWDSLPYDRARPSRGVTGARVAGLARLAEAPGRPRLVVTSAAGLLQRVPPRARLLERRVRLAVGDTAAPDWLGATLGAFGYQFEERVDEPGAAALRGGAADIFPAGAIRPVRLDLDGDSIVALHEFDPVDQRSIGPIRVLTVLPATEGFAVPGEQANEVADRLLPEGPLETLFDTLAEATLSVEPGARERIADWLETIADAWEARRLVARGAAGAPIDPPDRLYLRAEEISAALADRSVAAFGPDEGIPLTESLRPGHRSVLADVAAIPRPHAVQAAAPLAGDELRVGDLVVEQEHGLARLAGLTLVEERAGARECLALEFAADQRLLIAAEDAGRVWRYGSANAAAAPDRLTGEAWRRRRSEVEAEIAEMAAGIAERRRARVAAKAPAIVPPRAAMDHFVRRVPFALTEDQQTAIDATLADMARARPMERMVCGDVGFGKTEVALHAATAAVLAGFQVAVAAPTTLLARQHLETFRRRLGGLGLRIAPLVRSARSAESRETLAGLRSGEVRIVVGTHALAAAGVSFANLGLVVIDEEQRFGDVHKRRLRAMRQAVQGSIHGGIHALTMTATPLPRSLQSALLGLFDLSLLTTPPVARQPVRSFVVDDDDALVRTALLREARRGGQSFVVCPRIADLAPIAGRLAALVPELTVAEVHGKLRDEALDSAMLAFAAGQTDVLLATGIIEAGLDIPNANTMLVWRPDRFGLAQLHQLRGRVGRARARAAAYLLTDPAHPIAASARKRLDRIAALDSLGAGFAVSAADLDQRGAGDILGERQAGHVRLMGSELYGHMLGRALAPEPTPEWTPALAIEVAAYIPAETVPEPDLRLELYRRLARLESHGAVNALAEEIEDRFGDLPPPASALLDLARLRLACRALQLAAVHAGPGGIALEPREGADVPTLSARLAELAPLHWSRERLILEIAEPRAETRLARLLGVLRAAA